MIKLSYESKKIRDVKYMEGYYYESLKSVKFDKNATIQGKLGINTSDDLNIEELFDVLKASDALFRFLFCSLKLSDLLLTRSEELPDLINQIENKVLSLTTAERDEIKEKVQILFDYSGKFQKTSIFPFFSENFSFCTCHYCNRMYTTDLVINYDQSGKQENVITYQLDHFYEKAHYPYLSLSLYNLIPCCSTCNTTIKNRLINNKNDDCYSKKCLPPNHEDFDFHAKVKFRTFFSGKRISRKEIHDFELCLVDQSKQYKNYINLFQLNERYKSHKDIVLEMIQKRDMYPDSKIIELSKLTRQSIEKVKQDLFGTEIYSTALIKKPLSKLTQDIAAQLGLIKSEKVFKSF